MNILLHSVNVTRSALDFNRHVNNLEYLKWMQEAAIKHSTHFGWPPKRYLEIGYSWVVGSHYIEYLRPAFEDDRLGIVTWVSEIKSRMMKRHYWCINKETKKILSKGETMWIFVRGTDGKPCRIIDELKSDYMLETNEDEVREFLQQIR